MKKTFAMMIALALALYAGLGAEAEPKTAITFADVGWDSICLHNAVAGTIAEAVFGYTWEEVSGSTPITSEALQSGDIDVHMEMWTDNLATYPDDIAAGRMQELGVNFDDNAQGLYVPRYVIEGDPARGIQPVAPDLKTVEDLKKYAAIFPDPEDPGKGRIFGGLPGWEVTTILEKKIQHYGLDQMYNYVLPGSDAAMSAAFVSAWDKGEPMVAYYWEPTWLLGQYDCVLLEDAPYNPDTYANGETAFPATRVTICVSNAFKQSNPEYCEFLSKYHTTSALSSEALAHMQESGDDYVATAKWFLKQHPELIDQWLTTDQASKLRAAL
jgi:glycine betaine/proline transport system permease protein/glycine betaine/proline transport system substrate-binding protein